MGDLLLVTLGAVNDLTERMVRPSSQRTCCNQEKWED